ncbi:synaptotagmin-5 [Brassica napus]|uniref:synaptotagmin-5 n=1 Tax=Brassica oleracea var. oleracea TaxID=109376 RepID=UPI0006A6BEC8|nr:PREDICTED: synaptotagmin-5 [Brassica oleracea var. oleracea]XP_013697346.1 synaptotagmin-5 [Brassica napus]
MGFIVGLVIGLIVGITIIIGFVKAENYRSKLRSELANTVAAFARMTVEDSRKLLPAEFYPSWVVFSERQKLTWLNHHLTKIWPYVDEAASELIKASVEPVLEQYRPAIVASLTFSKLTLGTVAPQFTGVSIVEGDKNGMTMELDMNWDGNPNIVLGIKTLVGVSLPVQVKNIGFTGVFRLIFRPLVDEFPCFGAVSVSLREKKKLDFTLKVVGGDISAIPGLSDAIEETIRDAVEDSITWPVRKVIPILPGDYSDLELKPVGMLEVKLVQAKNLTNKDLVGKSDPFAKMFIRPLREKTQRSKTINNDLNPIWNEHFEFVVEDASTQHLVVRVYDDEGVQASELLGCAQIRLCELEPGKVKDVWLKLVKDLEIQRDNKNRGEVHLELLYVPFGAGNGVNPFTSSSMTSLEKVLKNDTAEEVNASSRKRKDVIVRGVLSVTVISAEEIPIQDLMGKADPFVVLSMKKSGAKSKTRVVNDSLNPVWNQTFDFVVEDGLHDMLVLEVWDHDTFGKDYIGRCILTLTRVIMEEEYTDWFELDESKAGKLQLHLKWLAQSIYRDS